LITDPPGLHRFLDQARDLPRIALDTEADSLHCYFEKLCLIQIATPGFSDLLDPLADVPLEEFFAALTNKEVVFHGADYDLRLLNRHGEFSPGKIFDTMLAARLAGEQQVGLAALISKYFGVELSKASQKANWAQRPLSQQMVTYALNDVLHLLELADILHQKLVETGRVEWLDEWIEKMTHSARNPREKDPDKLWRISGVARLEPRAQAVARSLWHWRDAEARSWDRPPFYVISNQDIIRISEDACAGRPFSTPRFTKTRRQRFEETLAHALQIPEEDWPITEKRKRLRPDPDFSRRFDELKNRRDRVARELDLEPSIIAAKAALEATAGQGDCDQLMNWQRRLLELPVSSPVANG